MIYESAEMVVFINSFSSRGGCGKSTILFELGFSLAWYYHRKVLLIEWNDICPYLSSTGLVSRKEAGLGDVFDEVTSLVELIDGCNVPGEGSGELFLLPGKIWKNDQRSLLFYDKKRVSALHRLLLSYAREHQIAYILFDTPSGLFPSSKTLYTFCDMTLYVIDRTREEKTSVQEIRQFLTENKGYQKLFHIINKGRDSLQLSQTLIRIPYVQQMSGAVITLPGFFENRNTPFGRRMRILSRQIETQFRTDT